MRTYSLTSLIALLLLLPASLHARTFGNGSKADNFHFGYISAAAGYTSLSQNINTVTTTGDLGWLVGAGYEFRRTSFWLSVGAQYLEEKSKTSINQDVKLYNGIDETGKEVEYYRWNIAQTDQQVWRTIDVPIMLGYYYSGFYVGAGAKVGFSMGSTITVNGSYDFSAKYKLAIEEFHDVGYYKHYNMEEQTFNCQLRPQFSILGEIGYDLLSTLSTNNSVCHVLKLGFYFEYGLRSVRGQESMDAISIDGCSIQEAREKGKDVRKATLNPYYLSTATLDKRVVPYFVGVKLTYMIGGNRYTTNTWHRGCQCYE